MAKILFVLPLKELKSLVSKTIKEYSDFCNSSFNETFDLEIETIVQIFGEKINVYKHNADIVVARGYTAVTLKKLYPNIPIVEIPITTMDVVFSAKKLQRKNINNEHIALIGFGDISLQANVASQLCDIYITPYNYCYQNNILDNKSIHMLIDEVSTNGFNYVIGGMRIIEEARKKNLISEFIECGRESIWMAIREAHHIAGIRRKERERAAHFETILNYSHEGIISADANNKIIHINSFAGKILNINTSEYIGTDLEKIILNSKFLNIASDVNDYSDELLETKNGRIILNKASTSLGKERIGNVITFQNINNVQNTEFKIRNKLYHRGLIAKYSFSDIIGNSICLKETLEKAKIFAKVPSNILIVGATGTGKELFAQSIHNYSERKSRPFVAVNCAAIPENLMESEFFGYAPGAFTGASKDGKMGFFELAHEGTIFLDEISEIPLNLQGKLLRVIQESEVMRIGGHDKIIPINIRIVCATNKDLKLLVKEGKFREDLYYRLCVLQLHLPLLRDRGQDVLLLSNLFISSYSSNFSKENIILSPEAQKLLLSYSWDGNIRELKNICEQLVVLNQTGIISAQEVSSIFSFDNIIDNIKETVEPSILKTFLPDDVSFDRKKFEKDLILKALKESNYNKTKAASLLGMNRTTLWKKLKEYNIECKATIL